jgi:putative membrane protein
MMVMNKLAAFSSVLVLAAGCAHHEYNESGSASTAASTTTYHYTPTGSYGYAYGPAYGSPVYTMENDVWNNGVRDSDYSNTSKGAGARALKANPFESRDDSENRTYTYAAPAGAAVIESETDNTSRGAGARALTGQPASTTTTTLVAPESSETVTTSASADTSAPNTQGQGARNLSGNTTETSSTDTYAYTSDAAFVREAGSAGLAEVRMGALAQQNSQDQSVKDFGQRLVTDHSKANEKLAGIAAEKGLQMPTTMSATDETMIEHLSSLNGTQFDSACKQDAIEAHEKAIRLFKAAHNSKDSQMRAFADETLPTLQEHLRMARALP